MDWIRLAEEIGFEAACKVNMDSIVVRPEVRAMCAADKCKVYGKSWACPPACGSLEHCASRIASYSSGILVQTVGPLEDEFDLAGIASAQKLHEKRFAALARQSRLLSPGCLPLSAGPCTRCELCSYPSNPCRFPAKMLSSMEANGLLVNDICSRSGIPYNHGKNTISFTSCILFT